MLVLKNIKKNYVTPGVTVEALKGVSLEFRKSEFVSILGPSGCGKTTLLNIIGGLDRYTDGDLFINNRSTKSFKDHDWDSYRNNSVGFVFQNYNLIPHQSVLGNVELALTLSGVSKAERRSRAIQALEKVGLHDQIYKRPNQLSGGQMQRVAIARAIVNDPEILLADEPTGALDSKTSIQILDILKEISKDRLVIMVTHNAELAHQYSNRIIELLDGNVINDSNPYNAEVEALPTEKVNIVKTAMSFTTALFLSLRNLITKKGRTMLTALAGSIGIIGIALVLSLSNGFTKYINKMQSDTLSGFPLTINQSAFISNYGMNYHKNPNEEFTSEEIVKVRDNSSVIHQNIINDNYLSYLEGLDKNLYNSISYGRALGLNIIAYNKTENNYFKVNVNSSSDNPMLEGNTKAMSEIIDNLDFVSSQYDVLKGQMPSEKGDLVLVVDSYNRISSRVFEALKLDYKNGESISFDEFLNMEFKLILNDDYYIYNDAIDRYLPLAASKELYENPNAVTLKIVGILRVKEDTSISLLSDGLLYTPALTNYVLENSKNSEIVLAQETLGLEKNVLTGAPFSSSQGASLEYKLLMSNLGGISTPISISIFPKDFESKEMIKDYLDDYNEGLETKDKIIVTDLSEMVTKTMDTLINTISYVLVAFAAISLVVSSIMIGIITYVSVIERTKEIGVLRSIGARKRDISRVFNAETVIIGFTAGLLGVLIALVLTIPINMLLASLVKGIGTLAILNPLHGIFLVVISVLLTLISGLIPSRIAAKKDPVVALRTE